MSSKKTLAILVRFLFNIVFMAGVKKIKTYLWSVFFILIFYNFIICKLHAEQKFLLGLDTSSFSLLLPRNDLSPETINSLVEGIALGRLTKGKTLWVNLQAFSPQNLALSEDLHGTQIGQALLKADFALKRLASEILRREDDLPVGLLRLLLVPTEVDYSLSNDQVLVYRIRLSVQLEVPSTFQIPKGILTSLSKKLEKEVNESDQFELVRIYLASILLGRLVKISITDQNLLKSHYYPYTFILTKYLSEYASSTLGGVKIPPEIPTRRLSQETTEPMAKIPVEISNREEDNITDLLQNFPEEGLLGFLVDEDFVKESLLNPSGLSESELVAYLEERLPPDLLSELESVSQEYTPLLMLHTALTNNYPVPQEVIKTGVRLWYQLPPKARDELLLKFRNNNPSKVVLITPKISRRKFLIGMGAVGLSLFLPKTSSAETNIDFFSLPSKKQKELVKKILKKELDPITTEKIKLQVKRFAKKLCDDFYLPRRSEEQKIRDLYQSRATFLLDESLQTKLTRRVIALRKGLRDSTWYQVLLPYFLEITKPNNGAPLEASFSVYRVLFTMPKVFPDFLLQRARDSFSKNIPIEESTRKLFYRLANDLAYNLNIVHDTTPLSSWKTEAIERLKSLPTEILYATLALKHDILYTATYKVLRNQFLSRVSNEFKNSFNYFVDTRDPNHILILDFLYGVSKREYRFVEYLTKLESNATRKLIKVFLSLSFRALRRPISHKYYTEAIIRRGYLIRAMREVYDANLDFYREIESSLNSTLKDPRTPEIVKYLIFSIFHDADISLNFSSLPRKREILQILEFLNRPPYPQTDLHCAIVFYGDTRGYKDEMVKLLRKKGYTRRSDGSYEKKFGNRSLVYHLIYLPYGQATKFKEIISDPKYHIVFTRHHSVSGRKFGGRGFPFVVPQFIGTKDSGYGTQNNLLALVLPEEIVKAASQNLPWEQLWKRMEKRMSLKNFIPPNDPIFRFSYIGALFHQKKSPLSKEIRPILIVDGGCGGINRIPYYITSKYIGPIKKFSSLPQWIANSPTLKKVSGLVLTIRGMSYSMIRDLQRNIDSVLRREEKQTPSSDSNPGGILISEQLLLEGGERR